MAYDDYKNEEQRQATILAKAMKAAADEVSKQFETPMLNALAGALVGLKIGVLSSIGDGKTRKQMMDLMDKETRNGVTEAIRNPNRSISPTAILGGKN